jgi:hypothetical protein
MSKQTKIQEIKEVITGIHKPITYMKIFVQATPNDEQVYFTKIPWDKSVEVICCNEAGARMLEEFLSTDIERLPFDDWQQLYGLLEKGGIEM